VKNEPHELFKAQCMMGTPVSEKLSNFYLTLFDIYTFISTRLN